MAYPEHFQNNTSEQRYPFHLQMMTTGLKRTCIMSCCVLFGNSDAPKLILLLLSHGQKAQIGSQESAEIQSVSMKEKDAN